MKNTRSQIKEALHIEIKWNAHGSDQSNAKDKIKRNPQSNQ